MRFIKNFVSDSSVYFEVKLPRATRACVAAGLCATALTMTSDATDRVIEFVTATLSSRIAGAIDEFCLWSITN